MDALRSHFKAHGSVHAVWLIAVLIGIIAALLLIMPNGKSVGDYIAFAASIASLVLAVVAIGQSLIANQSFSETIGSLRASAENVETAARNIADTSNTLSDQSERMIGEVSRLPPAFEELSSRLNERLTPPAFSSGAEEGEPPLLSNPMSLFDNTSYGGKATLYIASLARTYSKPIELDKIFQDAVWQNFVAGYLQALIVSPSFGLKIRLSSEGGGTKFLVDDMGEFPMSDIISQFRNAAQLIQDQNQKRIDSYFANDPGVEPVQAGG
jgi:hypothetical protein